MNRRRNRQHRRSRKQTSDNKTKSQAPSPKPENRPSEAASPEETSLEANDPVESHPDQEVDEVSRPPERADEPEQTEEAEEPTPMAAADAQTDSHAAESPLKPGGPLIDENTIYTGDVLREYREHKGISLRSISNITRIGVPSLMAVEEERYEDLPNARIYVLGFVRCLAQEIGLDREVAAQSYIARWQSWWDLRSEEDRRSYR